VFLEHVQYDHVTNLEQYQKLASKYSYDAMIVFAKEASFTHDILNDQAAHSKTLKWVHSLTHGVDNLLKAKTFADTTHIQITRASGMADGPLSEFIALGMLWHAKKFDKFREK
jgi:phosphoglycerate dehydrogenase-like enzyme